MAAAPEPLFTTPQGITQPAGASPDISQQAFNAPTSIPVDQTAPTGVDPNANLYAGLTQAIRNAPELASQPGIAVPVAGSADPAGNGQAVAHQTNNLALQRATARVSHHRSLWGSITHGLGLAAHDVGAIANKPLQLVQHEYRYLHDVEARHGPAAALGEIAVIGVGGAVAALAAPEVLAAAGIAEAAAAVVGTAGIGVLGGEGAAAALGHVLYKDSWDRTTDGTKYLDPHNGRPVSLGRDFASGVLGAKPGSGTFKWTSGLADGLSDLALDPVANTAGALSAVAQARTIVTTGADVERLYATNARVRRAFGDIARSDAGTIMRNYPRLVAEQAPRVDPATGKVAGWLPSHDLAQQLGRATSADQVAQVFREAVESTNLTYGRLPTLAPSITSVPIRGVRDLFADTRIVRSQQRLPMMWDDKTASVSNGSFDPSSPQAAHGIYQWLRGNGQAEAVARTVANNYINTNDLAQRIEIWKNAVQAAVVAQAERKGMEPAAADMLSNPENQRRIGQEISYLVDGIGPGRESVYGYGPRAATRIPGVATEEGTTLNAAILLSQTGKLSFPSMTEMRMASARLAGAQEATGTFRGLVGGRAQRAMSLAKIDEWTAEHYTQNLFKRWVLLNASFPLHVVLSEGVLNSLRLGAYNLLKSKLAVTAGSLAARYGGDDAIGEALASETRQRSIGAFVYHLLGKKITDPDRAAFAHRLALYNTDSGIVPSALTADHTMPYSSEEHYTSVLRNGIHQQVKSRFTDDFEGLGPESRDQPAAWRTWLAQITKDPPSAVAANGYRAALERGESVQAAHQAGVEQAKFWLDDHPEIHSTFLNAQLPTPGWDLSPLDAWAQKIMLNVRGATTGVDDTVHRDLLDAIVDGHFRPKMGQPHLPDRVTTDYLAAKDSPPALTHARLKEPDKSGVLQRVADVGYSKVVSPIINKWSREPIYAETAYRFWKQLEPAVADGRLTEEEAFTRANLWAGRDMIRYVHNLHERTQLSETLRNVAPFWFAQQQAYKRVGRLLATDPGAFRRYQLAVTALHDYTAHASDPGGNNYVAFPGSGFLGAGVPHILSKVGLPVLATAPLSFAGSLDSFTFIMPGAAGLPGTGGHPVMDFGPIVGLPVKAVASLFPELTPAASAAVGDIPMSEPVWKQLVPSATAVRVVDALSANSRGFTSSMMSTIQALDYQQAQAERAWVAGGRRGPEPSIVPGPDANYLEKQDFVNRVKNTTRIMYLVKAMLGTFSPLSPQLTVSDFGFKGEVTAAIKKAGSVSVGMSDFLAAHPDATPFTVSESTDPSGFTLPASVQAEHWINDHMGLIRQHPDAAFWLMPQLTDTAYNSAVYNEQIAQGIRVRRSPQQFLDALYVAAGNSQYYGQDYPAYQAALKNQANDPSAVRSAFNTYTQQFGTQNPTWYDDFQSKTRADRRLQTVAELQTILTARSASGPMVAGISQLLSDFATYNSAVAAGVDTKVNLAEGFESYLVSVAQSHPEFKPFILSVLGPLTSTRGASFTLAAQTAGIAQ